MANVFLQKKPIFFISLSIAKRLNAKVSKLEIGEKSPMNYFVTLRKNNTSSDDGIRTHATKEVQRFDPNQCLRPLSHALSHLHPLSILLYVVRLPILIF